jgi:predicted Zn-dependent protease
MALSASTNDQTATPSLAAQAAVTNQQIVTPDPVSPVTPGSPVAIHVNYTTAPANGSLTGLGLRIHYNSHLLTFNQLTDVLGTGLLQQQAPVDDTADYDHDPTTDKYVLVSWADINTKWPGQLPASLLTANLTASSTATGSTSVNFTSSATAAGWSFTGTSAGISFLPAQGGLSGHVYIDANHNGQFDPNEGLPDVTIILAGPVQKTAVTGDDGSYSFTDLPAGLYSLTEKQPAACLDGGQHSIPAANLSGNSQLTKQDFVEANLNPAFIPNRILTTHAQPVGSAAWKKVIRDMMARAETASNSAVAASTIQTNSVIAASTTQAPTLAHALTSALASPPVQMSLSRPMASVADANAVRSAAQPATNNPIPSTARVSTNQGTDVTSVLISQHSAAPLTAEQLKPIISEAMAGWAKAGLPASALEKLSKVSLSIADLPGSELGWTENNQVAIDRDAAGYGWFVDPTPTRDEEYQPTEVGAQLQAVDPQVLAQMDLLTVVEHELGHAIGLNDNIGSSVYDLMSGSLTPGVRRKVSVADVDAVFATYYTKN